MGESEQTVTANVASAANVTAAKPKASGAVFSAPLGTTLPTNAKSELDAALKTLGFISEDGLTNENSPESEDVKAWGGQTVLSSQTDKKQEQVSKPKDSKENKVDNSNNQSVKQQEERKVENKNLIKDTGEEVLKTPNKQDYKGKKLSDSEGVGTTGKIFKSQKEALDFGRKEVRRLVNEDKKPRQFSISKVTAEDGSLVGWTVDIFEDNDMEKVVSNPSATEENKE